MNGAQGLAAGVREWTSLPKVAAILAVLALMREMTRPASTRLASAKECQEKYCPTNVEVWVDSAMNTLLKDQSLGAGLSLGGATSLREPLEQVKGDYYAEQVSHPGVRLVAHAVA